jgi:LPS O-antigen subunit length determinant protein (WzzB/FepE family)
MLLHNSFRRAIEEQQQQIEQLKEALDIAFLRKMRHDVTDLNEVKNSGSSVGSMLN